MTYDKLTTRGQELARRLVNELKENGVEAEVRKTYMDYGQDWSWDTVIVGGDSGYQALSPKVWKDINNGHISQVDREEIVSFAIKNAERN